MIQDSYCKKEIEVKIEESLKERATYFRQLEELVPNTQDFRKLNALIKWNTTKISRLQERWRNVSNKY